MLSTLWWIACHLFATNFARYETGVGGGSGDLGDPLVGRAGGLRGVLPWLCHGGGDTHDHWE